MKLTWREHIFSLKNVSSTHRQLCVLGVRIKLRRPLGNQKLYEHLPVQPNKIVFRSVVSGYSCNPRYIAEEILRRGLPYDLVWVVDRHVLKYMDAFPPNIRLVMDGNEEAIREFATARVWVTNGWLGRYLRCGLFKREGQTYIQTWHGSLGFKRLNWKVAHPSTGATALLEADMAQFDYLLTNSTWEDTVFREAFHTPAQYEQIGHARNDLFFRADAEEYRGVVRKKIGVEKDKKLLLYVPTWREHATSFFFGEGDYAALKQSLEKRFGGDWLIAARWHPAHAAHMRTKFLPEESAMLNVSDYPDVQELLLAADAVITDYSSCILDFLFTRRPGFLYAPDYAEYNSCRGLYYPLEEAPFPVAKDTESLVQCIEQFDEKLFLQKTQLFLQKMGCMEDGHAAERAVNLIEHIISEK